MRRFLTLVCLLGLALPAGISISGCTRNPQGNYCNGLGYGPKDTDIVKLTLQPQFSSISLAYGQENFLLSPQAFTCKNDPVEIPAGQVSWGTSNNQLADISPAGAICAGTWNRNSGGGIADYTYCNYPNPKPSTNGLPYGVVYITASAASVASNPIVVYIHAPVTAISLVTAPLSGSSSSTSTSQQCYSQNQQAELDAQACYALADSNGVTHQYEFCAPASVTSNFACTGGALPSPNIVASGAFTSPSVAASGSVAGALYLSGGSITGTSGQTCNVSGFNNGSSGATATLPLTGSNAVAPGTPLVMNATGSGASAPPTQATLSNGTANCSGTIQIGQVYGSAGQYCYLTNFNNGSTGATASVSLTGTNTIAPATQLVVTNGGVGATAPPTSALMTSGTASCSGQAAVNTVLTPVPSCGASIGTLNFTSSNGTIASISPETQNNPFSTITALEPGTVTITASIAQSAGSAGYFSTCPPKSIKVTLPNNATSGVITQGDIENVTTTVIDTNNNPITGLSLAYQSTNPIEISSGGGGVISATYPGFASLYVVCDPPACNPAPVNEYGLNGTGLALASNPVNITVPGSTSDFVWFGAPGQSQYFSSIELLTGNPGASVRLPYVPNSMAMDQLGVNLYFGSSRELMIYSTSNNSLTRQDPSVPGVILAVSPNANQLLINDQIRGLFYLYSANSGASSSFAGLAACNENTPSAPCAAAAWTPDSQTLYIVDSSSLGGSHTDTLYVFNNSTGWSTYPLAASPASWSANSAAPIGRGVAITVPAVGAYLSGNPTVAHTWCPSGTVGNNGSILFYPQAATDSLNIQTDVLAATTDGQHLLGASLNGSSITLDDIALGIPASTLCPENTAVTPQTMSPLSTAPSINGTVTLGTASGATTLNATQVNQVVTAVAPTTSSVSTAAPIAFVTYNGVTPGNQLPYYLPQPDGSAIPQPGYLTFKYNNNFSTTAPPASQATAPLAGAFSSDNSTFFVSTAGDNWVHFISIPPNVSPSNPPVDSQQYSPNLPACTPPSAGGNDPGCLYPTAPTSTTSVPATVIVVKPRSIT